MKGVKRRYAVDLGLPSGLLWNKENHFPTTFVHEMPTGILPTEHDFMELVNHTKHEWVGCGMRFTGRSGESVFLFAEGVAEFHQKRGYYWCRLSNGELGAFVFGKDFCRIEPTDRTNMSFRGVCSVEKYSRLYGRLEEEK